jgi:hypothetical protein
MMSGPDPYEMFPRCYLRFNGYLSIGNFVLHEPIERGVRAGTASDILAVRLPYYVEEAGFRLEIDEHLVDGEASRERLVDFVIAEVKGGDDGLNKVWRESIDDRKHELGRYLIRWMGPLEDAQSIDRHGRSPGSGGDESEGRVVRRRTTGGQSDEGK